MADGAPAARRHWFAGVLAVTLLMLAGASLLPHRPQAPSSYGTGPGGMAALYALLRQEGVATHRWTRAGLPPAGVMVAAVGSVAPPPSSVARLARWIDAGHTLVLLGTAPVLQRTLHVVALTPPVWAQHGHVAVALPPLRGAPRLRLPATAALLPGPGLTTATPLYTAGSLPVALAVTRGSGQLWWFGSARVWDNATLARSRDNLVLAFGLLAGHRQVWFDEYRFGRVLAGSRPHPAAAGPTRTLPLPAQWRPATVVAGLALVFGAWAAAWRRHPPRPRLAVGPPAWALVEAYARLTQMARRLGRAVR